MSDKRADIVFWDWHYYHMGRTKEEENTTLQNNYENYLIPKFYYYFVINWSVILPRLQAWN